MYIDGHEGYTQTPFGDASEMSIPSFLALLVRIA